MGKKKPQKNKGEASQEQQKSQPQGTQQPQPTQPQPPAAQPTPGAAGPSQPTSSKGSKGKKHTPSQQQQKRPQERQVQEAPPSQPQVSASGDPAAVPKGKGKKQQKKQTESQIIQPLQEQPIQHRQEERPATLPVQGAWQQRGPQLQQQQRGPQDGRTSSQQSTPSPQPRQQAGPRGPQQQVGGRGKGRGQQQQHTGSPHSALPSPQSGQGPWQGQQPRHGSPILQAQQQPGIPQQYPGVPPQQYPGVPPQQYPGVPQQYQQQPGVPQQYQQQPGVPQQYQQQPGIPQQYQQHPGIPQQYQQHPGIPQQYQQQRFTPPQQYTQQQSTSPQQFRPPPGFVHQQQPGSPHQPQQVQAGPPPQKQQQPQQITQKKGWQAQPQPSPQQVQPPPQQVQQPPQQVQPTPQMHPTPQQQGGSKPVPTIQKSQSSQPSTPTQQVSKIPHQPSPPLDLIIPQRKKLKSAGTTGRRIQIETNHLALILRNLNPAVHYDVVIEPDRPKKLLRSVMEAFRRTYYPKRYPAFDGVKNLYSSPELPFGDQISGEVTVTEDDRSKKFEVTVKFAAMVDLSVLSRYFEGGQAGGSSVSAGDGSRHLMTPQDAIQCLDVVLRSAPALHCTPVGRSFFTKPRDQIINLGDGMEMYYGFYQSAILGWKPFLNVDVAHKAFPKSMRVIDLICELCQCDVKVKLNQYNFDTVDRFLRTLKVQYEIPTHPTSKRVMRVNSLDRPASEARFRTDDGQEMTVAQYFTNVKSYSLRYPNMPCLWVGSRQRESKILFPAELCTVLEAQVTNRAMTPNQTSEMIRVAATATNVRKEKIMHGIKAARFNEDPSAREFGISVDEHFAKVDARVLDAPMLQYARNTVKPYRGCWRSDTFKNGRALQKWCIVCVDDRTRPQALQEFADMMVQQGRPVGMQIDRPNPVLSPRLTYRKEKQEIEQQFIKLKDMQLILVVIPNENKDIYNYVKQVAELNVGTLTQCVRGRNVFRPKPATVGNILLKINAKLNGVNHVLDVKPRCLKRPCMIMGADVTHPSPDSRGTVPSVAAVTASHDPQAFQYNICWRLQPPAQEIITDLANIVKQHLLFFYTSNKGTKPEQIIFFRDGVSEGQFHTVLNAEVHTIRQACTMVQKDGMYKPKITFLVVQKRHHTRFFPTRPQDSEDKNFNVPAGTIVDTEITHPTALDFYLVSHASIQGVARPTKYRMLWDDNDMNEDELEQLTYHLCHLFTRCTRSVSYPAPTYYAHLAAARAKVYCERRQVNMDDLEREQEQLTVKSDIIKDLPMFFV